MTLVATETLGWGTAQSRSGDVQAGVSYTLTALSDGTVTSGTTDANGQIVESLASGQYTLSIGGETKVVDVSDGSIVKVVSESPQNVKLHGWVGNGDSLDAPITAALAELGANGGIIDIPAGDGVFSSLPSFKETANVTIRGAGGVTAGAQAATRLIYTGTGTRAVDARSSFGFKLQNLQVLYNNAGFSGSLIDYSHSISQDAAYMGIEHCYIGGLGVHGATCLLDLDKAIIGTFRDLLLTDAQYCVRGVAAPGVGQYSNAHHFDDVTFQRFAQYAILNSGEGWKFTEPRCEARIDGLAGFYTYSASSAPKGLTIDTPWFGDATTNDWIQFPPTGSGLVILGGEIGSGAVGVRLDAGNIHGVVILGTTFTDVSSAAVVGGGSGNDNWVIQGNQKVGSTPVIYAGATFPTNSRIQDASGSPVGTYTSDVPVLTTTVNDGAFPFVPADGAGPVLENVAGTRKVCYRIGGTWYKATLT